MGLGQYTGIIGGVLGGIIGGLIGGVPGASIGFAIGGTLGGIAGAVFWPEKVDSNHPPPPQPHESRLQISTYGAPIPIQYAAGRMAGNIIYMSDVKETIERSKHRQDGVRYYEMVKTYTSTFAIAFCEGPIAGIARIWVNGKIFADYRDPYGPYYPVGDVGLAQGNVDTTIAREAVFFSLHFGTETQTHDSALAAIYTAAETPAYRGLCYITFIDFPVGEFSGIPNIEIEIDENPVNTATVGADLDDSQFRPGSGNLTKLNNAALRVGCDTSETIIFMRFNQVRVRPAATVSSAIVTMHCLGVGISGRGISGAIYAGAYDNAAMPADSTEAWAYSSFSCTTTAHAHYSGVSEDKVIGNRYTFDVTAIVQEIVNRPGWVYGNSIVFAFISDAGANGYWDFGSFFTILSYDPPKIDIEWALN